MFDINGGEFLVLIVVALVVLGPERLPQYAQQLGRLVREVRGMAMKARDQVKAEMGDDFDDVDWKALDPRQYDPRRIVREALLDGDDDPLGLNDLDDADRPTGSDAASGNGSGRGAARTAGGAAGGAAGGTAGTSAAGASTPSSVTGYDDDAT